MDLLDVGGDILARGDEPTLKSPLADAIALAAASQVSAPVRLLVAGPGLDGELFADDLRPLLGPVVHTFTATDVEPILPVLEWHPSEATAMLAATTHGVWGTCKIRDLGLLVPLTDEGPRVHKVSLADALSRNELAREILTSATLDKVEAYSRQVCGFSEIDYAPEKIMRLEVQPRGELDSKPCWPKSTGSKRRTAVKGSHTTFRHITETLDLNGSQQAAVRQLLLNSRPKRHDLPLWRIVTQPE